jgi:hypothetical protein
MYTSRADGSISQNHLGFLSPAKLLRLPLKHPQLLHKIGIFCHNMSNTMDTDYGLPVPMHRPFITLDEQSDSQLPFRRRLEQVTELTAENATPYQLPKQQRLSAFECLPYEVREQIYGYLGIIPVNRSQRNRSTTSVILYKHDRNQYICNRGMLGVNRNIRQEVLSTFVLKLEMCFEYPLSDRKVFYNNWHNAGWSNFSRGP